MKWFGAFLAATLFLTGRLYFLKICKRDIVLRFFGRASSISNSPLFELIVKFYEDWIVMLYKYNAFTATGAIIAVQLTNRTLYQTIKNVYIASFCTPIACNFEQVASQK